MRKNQYIRPETDIVSINSTTTMGTIIYEGGTTSGDDLNTANTYTFEEVDDESSSSPSAPNLWEE